MSWWVYKCNSKQYPYQHAWGDWRDFFNGNPNDPWGHTEWVPALEQLHRGDLIIAYQTDRNELVGLARIRQSCELDDCLYLTPIETIGIKVHPLMGADRDDWGVCTNPHSPRAGLLTFEHMGCECYESEWHQMGINHTYHRADATRQSRKPWRHRP